MELFHTTNRPALLGGTPVRPQAVWPAFAGKAAATVGALGVETGRNCGFVGNDSEYRTAFERLVASGAGYAHGVGVTNGTRALAIATMAELHVRGDKWADGRDTIATACFTWVKGTVAGAEEGVLRKLGFTPGTRFFDARPQDWTVDEVAMCAWLREHHERVLIVVVPSLLDTFAQLETIVRTCRELELPVIHDGAQCGGARYPGEHGQWESESLQGGKLRGAWTGDGAMLMTDDPTRAFFARSFGDCGHAPAGVLNPLGGSNLPEDVELPWTGQDRLSGALGAIGLGTLLDVAPWLPRIRENRRRIGTEIMGPDEFPVFRTPPIQDGETPTYGFGLELTDEAAELYGISTAGWRDILWAEGFGGREYKFGVRTPYDPAYATAPFSLELDAEDFPRARLIHERGLMVHVGHLTHDPIASWLQEAVYRNAANAEAVRARLTA